MDTHAAGWSPNAPTPAQLKEFFGQIDNHRMTKWKLQRILTGTGSNDLEAAKAILGADFIRPQELHRQWKAIYYHPEQIQQLLDTMPEAKTLRHLQKNDFVLLPGPPRPFSLLDILKLEPSLFDELNDVSWETGSWKDEWWAKDEKVSFGWLALRKFIDPELFDKSLSSQLAQLSSDRRVPSAMELAWGLNVYRLLRGGLLFHGYHGRTQTKSHSLHRFWGRGQVMLGLGKNTCKLEVLSGDAEKADPEIGLAEVYKLPETID